MTKTAWLIAATILASPLRAQEPPAASQFVLHADDFWLNLHHFLYVLGRNESGAPDRGRRAVVGAPAEARAGVAALSPDERAAWDRAVTFYAQGPSQQDTVFDQPLVAVGVALARVGAGSSLSGSGLDASLIAVLEQAAPVYRQAFWSAHLRANEMWAASTRALLARNGASVVGFATRAYGLAWPAGGYPIRISAYSNWAGAYSTGDSLLVMSSLDQGNHGIMGIETSLHEAMHQWDHPVYEALAAQAKKLGIEVPRLLSHALIFYTAGEAVRSVAPQHLGYAEVNGLWNQQGFGAFRPALDAIWKPYLDGLGTHGTRDEAFAEILRRTRPAASPQAPETGAKPPTGTT